MKNMNDNHVNLLIVIMSFMLANKESLGFRLLDKGR